MQSPDAVAKVRNIGQMSRALFGHSRFPRPKASSASANDTSSLSSQVNGCQVRDMREPGVLFLVRSKVIGQRLPTISPFPDWAKALSSRPSSSRSKSATEETCLERCSQLAAALAEAKRHGKLTPVAVSKLERLSVSSQLLR